MKRALSLRFDRRSGYTPLWCIALASALPFAACGGDDDGHAGGRAGNAGSDAGRGGGSDGAGAGAGDDAGGHAGGDGDPDMACDPACEEPSFCENGMCVECSAGSVPRCGEQQTPEACVNGAWVPGTSCAETSQVCSNGVCVGRYLFGALTTVSGPSRGTGLELVAHGFEAGSSVACGGKLCLSGGIRP